jgi:acetyltransferase-like isoleucine patch superfamily enzyme
MDERDVTGAWDYATLPANVQVGAGCFLERRDSFKKFRSTRQPGLVLGKDVEVYTLTAFSVEPSGLITVGDGSVLVGAVFMCAEEIRIGERVVLSYQVTIADCDFHPRSPEARLRDAVAVSPFGDRSQRPPLVSRPVVIEDDVWVGIGAIVLKGVRIGRGARVGAGAVVTADVPPGARVVGNPARPVAEGEVGP